MALSPVLLSTAAPATLTRSQAGVYAVSGMPWLFCRTSQIVYVLVEHLDGSKQRISRTACRVVPVAGSLSPIVSFDPLFDSVGSVVSVCASPMLPEAISGTPTATEPFNATFLNGGIVERSATSVFVDAAVVPFELFQPSQVRYIKCPDWKGSPDHHVPTFNASRVYTGWIVSTVDPTVDFTDPDTVCQIVPAY